MVIRMLGEMHLCGQFEAETPLTAGAWTYRILEQRVFESSSRDEFDGLMDLLEGLPISGFRLTIQLLVVEGILRSGVEH